MESASSTPESKRSRRRWFQDLSGKLKKKPHVPTRSGPQSPPRVSNPRTRSPSPALPPGSRIRSGAWRGLEATMQGLQKSAEVVPPVHSAISGLVSVLSVFEAATRHRQDYEKLASDLGITADFLRRHLQTSKSAQMTATISEIVQAIEKEIGAIDTQQDRSIPSRMLAASYDEEDLIQRYRRIEQLLHQLQIEVSMSAWGIANANQVDTRLRDLEPAKLATYNSKLSTETNRRTCTENTRKAILSELNTWSDQPDVEKIYWMDGMAGTGKTTIACTLSDALKSRGQLAASFFCTRTAPECRDASRIVPTIAYQLSRHSTPFQSALCRALEKDPDVASLTIATQFERLLRNPLLEVKENMPNNLVVVIDALDECDDSRVVELVLDALFRFAANLPLKFFITSRPEPVIRSKIMPQDKGSRTLLHLHDIEQSLVQADIEVFLWDELAFMSPSPDQVKQLTQHSGGLFIYAATAVRYIRPGRAATDPNKRLETMLAVNSQSQKKFEQIDKLYSTILSAALDDDVLEPEEQDRMRLVLWTVICAREPVPVKTLTALVGLNDESQALAALQPLRSVLHFSEDNSLVSTLHASFPDHMLSQARSGRFFCDEKGHNQLLAHRCFDIMKGQLRFNICNLESSFVPDKEVIDLKDHIEKNITQELSYACRYWAAHLVAATTSNRLRELVDEFLSQRLLFWMEVMNLKECMVMGTGGLLKAQGWLAAAGASPGLLRLTGDAYKFAASFSGNPISLSTPHIYISALPLTPKSSSVSARYRQRMQGLIEVKGTAMARMGQAALTTWSTKSSITCVAYSPDGTKIAYIDEHAITHVRDAHDGKVVVGPLGTPRQGAGVAICSVGSLAFSPDGICIVSTSDDHIIRVWNAHDGTLAAGSFQGHTDMVRSVAFSPNSACIVSGSDDQTIRVWNANGGTPAADPFEGHTRAVTSVAFSPNGARIVSGSEDRTIRLWNAHDGTLTADPFRGHTDSVTSVAFSPDGAHVVSGSNDHTIQVWNARDGTLVAGPFRVHTDSVLSVAFSPDGTRIVSGSNDHTIRVSSIYNGTLIGGPFQGHISSISSVAFSPDGARIVSGSYDSTVRVWNAHDRTPVARPLEGHTRSVTFVAYSPDGAHILSGSEDQTIRMWNAHDGTPAVRRFNGHTGSITSLAFSPDGARIVSGSSDGTIWVWNAHDGTHAAGLFWGRASQISSVSFLPDSAHIVSCSSDCTIWVWNVHDETLTAGPFDWPTEEVISMKISPDGAYVVSGSADGTIHTLNVRDGTTRPFQGHTSWVRSVSFSPDGTRIVSGSEDRTLRVWNAQDGTLVASPFEGHTRGVTSVAFSPDSAHIVSGSFDQTIRVWNSHNGTLVAGPFQGHTDMVTSVAFSPDSARIVSGSRDLTIRVCSVMFTTQPSTALADSWIIRNDGWVLNSSSQLLFWVPAEIRGFFPQLHNPFTIGQWGDVQVDYNNLLLGNDWSKCYVSV